MTGRERFRPEHRFGDRKGSPQHRSPSGAVVPLRTNALTCPPTTHEADGLLRRRMEERMNVVKFATLLFLTPLMVSGAPLATRDLRSTENVETNSIPDFLITTDTMPLVLRAPGKGLLQPSFSSAFNSASPTIMGFSGTAAGVAAARSRAVEGSGLACGPALVCEQTTQYCITVFRGPAGAPPAHSCADFPESGLSPPTCESIQGMGIGCKCTESDGGITVTCTAP